MCAPAGQFRLKGEVGSTFVDAVLPWLYGKQQTPAPDWLAELGVELTEIGLLVKADPEHGLETVRGGAVSIARDTDFSRAVADQLTGQGIAFADVGADLSLVDVSGLRTDVADALVRDAFDAGRPAFPVWTSAADTFYGPLVSPGQPGCWHCCRARLSDGVAADGPALSPQDAQAVRIVAQLLVLFLRYPAVAPIGWFVIDNGSVAEPHSFLPMPWCAVCGGAADPAATPPPALTQSPVLPADLRVLADSRAGIVRHLFLVQPGRNVAPELPISCSATIAPVGASGSHASFTGEGKGSTQEQAVRGAVGEGVERYSASVWHETALTYASLGSLVPAAFDPRTLVLYDENQYRRGDFPFCRFDPDAPIHWVSGRWLENGQPVWVPALTTFMHFRAPRSEQFAQVTSNGLAAGHSFEDAALRALYELIERDAFMLHWLAQRPATSIELDHADPITEQALQDVRRLGAEPELYLLDAGTGHPTVVCLGLGDGRSWPAITIGLAAHANLDVAIRRAVLEHGHCGAYIRRLMGEGRHREIRTAADVRTALDHGLYYVPVERQPILDGLRGKRTPVPVSELRPRYQVEPTLNACVAALSDAGIRCAAVDVTAPDVALTPLRVVRAFGEYLQPIHFGTGNQRTDNPRLHAWLHGEPAEQPHPIA